MDLLFLGTSAGVPTKRRNVSATALIDDTGRSWYLIDCGEATQHQLLHAPLSLNNLQAIFITHVHGDHCYGLPGLLASAGMTGRTQPLTIVSPAGIERWIETTRALTQLYLPFELNFIATESLSSWRHENLHIEATALSHRVPSFAYSFSEIHVESTLDTEKLIADGVPRGPLWGQLKHRVDVVREGRIFHSSDYLRELHAPRRIVIAGDNDQPTLLSEACQKAQVLVHEATYTQAVADRVGAGTGHSSAQLIASFAQAKGLPNLVLTHFSARYQMKKDASPSIEDVQAEARAHYAGRLFLAEDFARYRLSKTGVLSCV